jgi:hypothetical protein
MARSAALFILALALVFTAAPAGAVGLADGKLNINGYGNWHYGKTDGNTYLGDEDGDWQAGEVTLSFVARPTSEVTLHIQPFWEMSDEGVETEIDMAFAEYSFSDLFNLRFGIARHPFGIYTPIYDVGTQRPFMTLPTALYDEQSGFIAESYAGVGATGQFSFPSGWGIDYDLYGGALDIASTQPWEGGEEGGEATGDVEQTEFEDLVGGKLVVETPVSGLSFGGSIYTATATAEVEDGALEGHRNTTWGLQVEYLTERILFRGEYAMQSIEKESESKAGYAEAAYMVTKHLQVAGRYEMGKTDLDDAELERVGGEPDSALLEHEEIALGVNWWFSPDFVFKLSYHMVDGLRFATPEGEGEADDSTNAIVAGVSYSF